jgi:hypothetical protein
MVQRVSIPESHRRRSDRTPVLTAPRRKISHEASDSLSLIAIPIGAAIWILIFSLFF